jgi:amidase
MSSDYDAHDGLGLAELIRTGQVSALELVDEAIRRAEAVNPRLNAVIHPMYEQARAAARGDLGEGPFAGVPFLLKDLLASYAGEPLTSGSRLFRGYVPTEDSEIVRRFKRGGFLTIGKTSTPELGIMPVTEAALWGPTRNPWDLERTPGGSSGGSGAAVAAGVVPIASGGDGGGSIRIPSAACGLFGLKPSRGRTPTGPDEVEHWAGCAIEHVLTRSVRDSAAVLDVLAGPDVGALHHAPAPARPFQEEVGAPVGRLKIAFSPVPGVPAEVHADCLAGMERAAKLCEELGHEVVEAGPEVDQEAFALAFMTMICGEIAASVRDAERTLGRRARGGDLEPGTAFLRLLGETLRAGEFAHALADLKRSSRAVGRFFNDYDVLLTPTTGTPPPKVGTVGPQGLQLALLKVLLAFNAGGLVRLLGVLEKEAQTAFAFAPFTMLFNASGNPAMSMPLHWTSEGLPIGVQFVGRYGDEATLLRLAAQLEEAHPWRDRRPGVHASE